MTSGFVNTSYPKASHRRQNSRATDVKIHAQNQPRSATTSSKGLPPGLSDRYLLGRVGPVTEVTKVRSGVLVFIPAAAHVALDLDDFQRCSGHASRKGRKKGR